MHTMRGEDDQECIQVLIPGVYLHGWRADDDQHKDIQEKNGKAMSRCGKLRPILNSPDLCVSVKLRLYQAVVYSL